MASSAVLASFVRQIYDYVPLDAYGSLRVAAKQFKGLLPKFDLRYAHIHQTLVRLRSSSFRRHAGVHGDVQDREVRRRCLQLRVLLHWSSGSTDCLYLLVAMLPFIHGVIVRIVYLWVRLEGVKLMQEICRLSGDGGRFLRARHFEARQKAADYVGCISGPVSSSPLLMLPTTRSVRFRPRRVRSVVGFKDVFAFYGLGFVCFFFLWWLRLSSVRARLCSNGLRRIVLQANS